MSRQQGWKKKRDLINCHTSELHYQSDPQIQSRITYFNNQRNSNQETERSFD